MRQLSARDAGFLYSDTSHSNANVTLIQIYDQSTAPGGKVRFKSILAHIESRLAGLPMFRSKLQRVPLDLDHPYWVDDPNFDLEYHVRHIALPKPGDWRQFCIQASRIHARPLDQNRPLWEIYVVEGLDSLLELPAGSFALLTKTHHAALDFEHDGELTARLHDTVASAAPPPPPAPWFADGAPSPLPLLARGLLRQATTPWRAVKPLAQLLRKLAPERLALAGDMLLHASAEIPLVRFNAVVSPHRVFETRRFTLDEFDRIRRLVPGATVQDAVLAVCGGALRRYLDAHDELPAPSLLALASADAGGGAPWRRVSLATDVQDPLQRLRAIRAQTSGRQAALPALAAAGAAPAPLLGRAARQLAQILSGERRPLAACSITQVPGPQMPLYLCGARMSYFSAMLPVSDGLGLAIAVTSYDGRIVISPTSCRDLMPDPEHFAQALRDSFQELLALAPAAAAAAPRPAARRRRRAAAGA